MRSALLALSCAVHCISLRAQTVFDPTFGVNGLSYITLPGDSLLFGVTDLDLAPDGKILLAEYRNHMFAPFTSSELAVIRLTPDGALDSTFANGGVLLRVIPYVQESRFIVKALPDGRCLVAGCTGSVGALQTFVIRLTAEGDPDATFGTDGMITDAYVGDNSRPHDMVVQPDGKTILALGFSSTYRRLLRLNTDGGMDSTFGTAGILPFALNDGFTPTSPQLHVRTDGKLVLSCSAYNPDPFQPDLPGKQVISIFTPEGQPDTTFEVHGPGVDHLLDPLVSVSLSSAVFMPDESIYFGGTAVLDYTYWSFAVAHVDAHGALDPAFGDSAGYTIFTNESSVNPDSWLQPADMLVTSDGKILLYATYQEGADNYQCELVRFNSNGHLDESFGTNGRLFFSGDYGSSSVGMVQQSDGRIVVCAGWSVGETGGSACLRLAADDATGVATLQPMDDVELSLWPNPNHDGRLTMTVDDLGQVVDKASVSITDMFGRLVYSRMFSVDGSNLNVAIDLGGAIANGMYIVQVSAGEQVLVRRLEVD